MRIIRHSKPVPSYWIPYWSGEEVCYQEGEPEIEDEWFELNPESLAHLFSEDLVGPKDEAAKRVQHYLDNPDEYIRDQVWKLTGMEPEQWFIEDCRKTIGDHILSMVERYWMLVRKELLK